MKDKTLKGWAIKTAIWRNYAVVVALLMVAASMIYAKWPADVRPVSTSGGIHVLDLRAFVRNDVSCKDGVAVVAIHSYESAAANYFEPINVQAEGSEQPTPISCEQGEYKLNGATLSELQLGNYALDSVQHKKNR